MGYKYAGLEFRKDNGAHGRKLLITSDIVEATTISGGVNGVWDITTIGAGGYDVLVACYDESRHNDYQNPPIKPTIVIKCSADASANNVTISNSSGVLYTFAADYSVTPGYIVLALSAPTAGKYVWALA